MTQLARMPIDRRTVAWLALALLPYVAVSIARWDQLPSETDGDYAQYLLHAKAIVEGRPYSDIGYIYTDLNLIGPRTQPPGWPLVLAPVVAAFGVHSAAIKVLVTSLVAAFALAAGAYFTRRWGVLTGAAVTMAVPLALETERATQSPLSDPLCCLLIWLALLVADRDDRGGLRRNTGLAALAVGATLVRVAGVAMIPALAAHAIVRRRANPGRVALGLVGAGLAGLFLVALVGDSIPFIRQFLAGNTSIGIDPLRFISSYRTTLSLGALYPFDSDGANDVYHVVIAVPMIVGAVRFAIAEYRTAIWWFALSYGGLLVASPLREVRYAWPLLPLVMFWIVTGLTFLFERIPRPVLRVAMPRILAALIVLVGVGASVRLIRTPPRPALQDDPPTLALFDELRRLATTAPTPRVVFTNPRVLTLETGVPAMGEPYGSIEGIAAELEAKAITHVVLPVRSTRRSGDEQLASLVRNNPGRFTPTFRNARYELYAVTSSVSPPGVIQ
jgi:hypothetical protein